MEILQLLIDASHSLPGFFLTTMVVFGLIAGSFINVAIHRLPIMMEREWQQQCAELTGGSAPAVTPATAVYNLLQPRSRCPHCGHAISVLENIPLISYAVQRGRCRGCRAPISLRYPLIECLGGLTAGICAWHFGISNAAFAATLLGFALIALTFIDLDHFLLPDSITLPFLWLGIGLSFFNLFAPLADSVIGAMAGYMILWTVYWLHKIVTGKEGMGYGDFKLLAMLGAWLGWQQLPMIILLSSLVGATLGIAAIVLRGRGWQQQIPFGPYLAIAGWIALIWGPAINEAYLGL